MLHPLDLKLEATYGFSLLAPGPYRDYLDAIERNPKLRDGLNVSRFPERCHRYYGGKCLGDAARLLSESGGRCEEPGGVPPALETLDPAASCVVLSAAPFHPAGPEAAALVLSFGEQWYRIHYHAVSPSLPENQRRLVSGVARRRGRQAAADRACGSCVDGC